MSREALDVKALRYLREGRLRVVLVDGASIAARVRGTDTEHVAGYERGGWYCDCEAHLHGRRCLHLAALQLVTAPPAQQARSPARRHSA